MRSSQPEDVEIVNGGGVRGGGGSEKERGAEEGGKGINN